MNKQITANKKKLSADINKAFVAMESAKKNYVFSIINLGEKLIEAKESVGFGEWKEWLKVNSELTFGHEQATKYMKIARHKELVVSMFGSQDFRPSVNQITKAISQKNLLPPITAYDDEIIDRVMIEPSQPLGRGDDGAIDAEFTVVAPQPAPDPNTGTSDDPIEPSAEDDDLERYDQDSVWEPAFEDDQPEEDLQAELKRVKADNAWMKSIFDDDNHTAAAIREIETQKIIKEALQSRIDSLVAENSSLVGKLNNCEARCKKLEKAHAKE